MPTPITWPLVPPAAPASPAPETPTAYDATQYAAQLWQLLPRGRVWNPEQDSKLRGVLLAIGDELARVDARGMDLIDESDPRTADETIGEWEGMLSLPDERVTAIPATLAERRIAVTQKYVETGGQSVAFFTRLALACGYVLQPVGFLAAPVITEPIGVGGFGTRPAGTYSFRVTAKNDAGESLPSAAVSVTTALVDRKFTITWGAVVGATSYRVFGNDGAGVEKLLWDLGVPAEVQAPTVSFISDGVIPAVGPLPVANTAATEPITRYVDRMCRVGIARCGDRLYGAAFAYSMRLNIMPPSGTVLPAADFQRVIRHACHSHITVTFNYL